MMIRRSLITDVIGIAWPVQLYTYAVSLKMWVMTCEIKFIVLAFKSLFADPPLPEISIKSVTGKKCEN
jgi:hypothetical protein